LRFSSNENTAVREPLFLEGRVPSRVYSRSVNDSRIAESTDSIRRIRKLALGEKRVTKIVCNTELKASIVLDQIVKDRSWVPYRS